MKAKKLIIGIIVWVITFVGHAQTIAAQESAMEQIIAKVMDVSLLAPITEGATLEINVSFRCKESLKLLKDSLNNGSSWALKMLDASGKVGSDIDSGRNTFQGSYRECSKINVEGSYFSGKFCTSSITLRNETRENATWLKDYTFDVCAPSSCSSYDLHHALLKGLEKLELTATTPKCYEEKSGLENCQKAGIVILSLLFGMVLFGTTIDVIQALFKKGKAEDEDEPRSRLEAQNRAQRLYSKMGEIAISFSLYTNAKSVLSTHRSASAITALDGIRVLSTAWIILYHTFYQTTFLAANLTEFHTNRHSFAYQAVLNASISVDTFFLLGGLLVAYVNLKKLKKSKDYSTKDYLSNFFHRFWRLTPPVLFAILFVFVWPLLASGPEWETSTSLDYEGCRINWWKNIIYLNNFLGLESPCMDHLWYLANDMQFFLIAPAIFILLHRYPLRGLLLNGALLFVSILIAFVLGAVYDLQATTLFFLNGSSLKMFEGYKKVYTKPYTRIGPYCLGLFLGYLLVKTPRVTLKPIVQIFGWILSFIFCFSTLYGVYNWNQGLYGNRYLNAAYLALHRPVWALGVAWVCYACALGYGGIVNSILSWKAFGPLSKLTYIAYIIHPLIVKGLVGVQAEKLVMNDFLWVILYIGIVGVAFGLSFPISLCIEVPFQLLEKIKFRESNIQNEGTEPRDPICIISPPNYSTMGRDNEAFAIENGESPSEIQQGAQRLLQKSNEF